MDLDGIIKEPDNLPDPSRIELNKPDPNAKKNTR
jgi:hypothetical protein